MQNLQNIIPWIQKYTLSCWYKEGMGAAQTAAAFYLYMCNKW